MDKELNLLPFALHDLFVSDARDQPTPLNCCQSLFFSPWSMEARRDEWSKPATHPLTLPSPMMSDTPTSDGSARLSPTRTPSMNPIQRPRTPLHPRSLSATDFGNLYREDLVLTKGSGDQEPQQKFNPLVYQEEEQELTFVNIEQAQVTLETRKKSRKNSQVSQEEFFKTPGRKRASSFQGQQKGHAHGEDSILQKGRSESLVENLLDEKDKEGKRITLYKTEVCRSFEETGKCKFGDRCLFAHGHHELRQVRRHPRYKTEVCKSFWEEGQCKYGKRCCFLHMENSERVKTPSKESAPHMREKSLKSVSKVLGMVVLDENNHEEGVQHLVNDKFSCPENRRLK